MRENTALPKKENYRFFSFHACVSMLRENLTATTILKLDFRSHVTFRHSFKAFT